MGSFSRLQHDTNTVGIEFLMTELDAAFTFLDVAAATSSTETRERNHGHAVEAYNTICRLRGKVVMDPYQQHVFQEKLALLTSRLKELGYKPG